MNKVWQDDAWADYLHWQKRGRKKLHQKSTKKHQVPTDLRFHLQNPFPRLSAVAFYRPYRRFPSTSDRFIQILCCGFPAFPGSVPVLPFPLPFNYRSWQLPDSFGASGFQSGLAPFSSAYFPFDSDPVHLPVSRNLVKVY